MQGFGCASASFLNALHYGRELSLNGGEPFRHLLAEIDRTAEAAGRITDLREQASRVKATAERLKTVAEQILRTLKSEQMPTAFVFAYLFMEATGDTLMAWMLLWRAVVAHGKRADGAKKKDQAFYDGQLKSAQFFINTQLPVTLGKMDTILSDDNAVTAIGEDAFGGK
jgi:hypothetical protein